MKYGYSSKKNIQMLISLLKENNIRKIVASPGSTHLNFLISCQQDDFFEMYSELDERNAAYMACGMAAESGEPVIIACTGATASRNYLPALTEAYHRKIPIIAITGSQDISVAGNLSPQFIDRSHQLADVVKMSVHIQAIKDDNDYWDVNLKLNKVLSELTRHGGGPVHINLTSEYPSDSFGVFELSQVRVIRRYFQNDNLPGLPIQGKIAITVGAHKKWTDELVKAVDDFCSAHDAIVFVDHSSGYYGKYRVLATLLAAQEQYKSDIFDISLLIHIGEESGDYYTFYELFRTHEVWRVSEDGEMRDTFHKLSCVFEMPEEIFFKLYTPGINLGTGNYLHSAKAEIDKLYTLLPDLPFSNIWLAKTLSKRLPINSVLHLGVSNTMRSWTFFEMLNCKLVWANTGCRGIDGALPAAMGMSLVGLEDIHFCVLGDLTFFYGMNALGNRNINSNLRIILINNGRGTEFRLYPHLADRLFGNDADKFIAAAGHFGNQSPDLVRDFSVDLGFEYYSAYDKEGFMNILDILISPNKTKKPILVEVFTSSEDENDALKLIRNIISNEVIPENSFIKTTKKAIKRIIKGS